MPIITIEGPAMADVEQKRQLARDCTAAAVKAYGLPEKAFIVLIKENSGENVAVGGILVKDLPKS